MSNSTIEAPRIFDFKFTLRLGSGNIRFPDWIATITLCLAPLIAHVVAGAPRPVYLHSSRPRWHDRVVLYNPTSIVWRYFAITDRRVRAQNWNDSDLAATNAVFWTACGWNGSEDMLAEARDSGIRAPSKLERLLSVDTLKTTIVTLQGAQAVYVLVVSWFMSLDTLFMPLAIISLLRLPAALWLTDERFFADRKNTGDAVRPHPVVFDDTSSESFLLVPSSSSHSTFPLVRHKAAPHALFRKTTSIRGLTLRLAYLIVWVALILLWMTVAFPQWFFNILYHEHETAALSEFLAVWFYGLWLFISIIIYLPYSVSIRDKPMTTVIPCISHAWYKVFTCLVLIYIVTMIVICILETRRISCGMYTVLGEVWDGMLCDYYMGNSTISG